MNNTIEAGINKQRRKTQKLLPKGWTYRQAVYKIEHTIYKDIISGIYIDEENSADTQKQKIPYWGYQCLVVYNKMQ